MYPISQPPDIVRSLQKDDYFLASFRDECRELASSILGRRSARFESEVDLLSAICYHSFTTLIGHKTLGEEYCDIIPMKSWDSRFQKTFLPSQLTPQQRTLLIQLNHLRLQKNAQQQGSQMVNGSSASHPSPQIIPTPSPSSTSPLTPLTSPFNVISHTLHSSHHMNPSSSLPVSLPLSPSIEISGPITYFSMPSFRNRLSLVFFETFIPYFYHKIRKHGRQVQISHSQQFLRRLLNGIWNSFVSFIVGSDGFVSYIQRFHLALFYLFGQYLQISKRVVGIRYLFVRRGENNRMSYELLGILLLIQLIVIGLQNMKKMVTNIRRSRNAAIEGESKERREEEEGEEGEEYYYNEEQKGEKRNKEDEESAKKEANEEDEKDEKNDETNAQPTCTLCLSTRQHSTVTECGHVFCWGCITRSCDSKPECPLCRQPIAVVNLLRLAHY